MLIRKGQCNRCGQCCIPIDIDNSGKTTMSKEHCRQLGFKDDEAFCQIYEKKPKGCNEFPQDLASIERLKKALEKRGIEIKNCGFYFEKDE